MTGLEIIYERRVCCCMPLNSFPVDMPVRVLALAGIEGAIHFASVVLQ